MLGTLLRSGAQASGSIEINAAPSDAYEYHQSWARGSGDPPALTQSSLNSTVIGHTFLTLLTPLLAALLLAGNPHSRHRPILILNVAVIILAFAEGMTTQYRQFMMLP